MGKGSALDLENAVRHLPDRDISLRWMHTSTGEPVEASTNCFGDYLAVAIAQRRRAQGLR